MLVEIIVGRFGDLNTLEKTEVCIFYSRLIR